jgi:hypothetical protein
MQEKNEIVPIYTDKINPFKENLTLCKTRIKKTKLKYFS